MWTCGTVRCSRAFSIFQAAESELTQKHNMLMVNLSHLHPLSHIPEPHLTLPVLSPHVALDTLLHSPSLHHSQEQKLGKEQRFGEYNPREEWRQQAQLQISLKHGQRQDISSPTTKHQHNLLSLQPWFRHFIWLFSRWQVLYQTPYAH